jgi:hypothetical protein
MSTNVTANNLAVSGNTTMSGKLTSTGDATFNSITSTTFATSSINNTTTLNATTANITNTNLSNNLNLLAQYPIKFTYNGIQYTMSTLMLFSLFQQSGASLATQAYVTDKINALAGSNPSVITNLQALADLIVSNGDIQTSIMNYLSSCPSLSGNNQLTGENTFTGSLTTFNNNIKVKGTINNYDIVNEFETLESDITNINTSLTAINSNINGINTNATNLQNQINNKLGALSPLITNLYINNSSGLLPNINNGFGAICGNLSGGSGELNIINNFTAVNTSSAPAFKFSKMTNATTNNNLLQINNNGDCIATGKISALDIITTGTNGTISLNTTLLNQTTENNSLQTQINNTNTNVSTLQGQMTTTNTNVSTLQGQMTTTNNNVSTLQNNAKSSGCLFVSGNITLPINMNSSTIIQMDGYNNFTSAYTITLPLDVKSRSGMELIFTNWAAQTITLYDPVNNVNINASGTIILKSNGIGWEIIYDSNFNDGLRVNGNIIVKSGNINANNLLLQGDGTNAYIKPTNANSILNLGANNKNKIAISDTLTDISNNVNVSENLFINTTKTNGVDNGAKLSSTSGSQFYINNDKTSGDLCINTGSLNSNVNIANGNISTGKINNNVTTTLNIYPAMKGNIVTDNYVTYDISGTGTHYFWDNVEVSGNTTMASATINGNMTANTLTSNTLTLSGDIIQNGVPTTQYLTDIFTFNGDFGAIGYLTFPISPKSYNVLNPNNNNGGGFSNGIYFNKIGYHKFTILFNCYSLNGTQNDSYNIQLYFKNPSASDSTNPNYTYVFDHVASGMTNTMSAASVIYQINGANVGFNGGVKTGSSASSPYTNSFSYSFITYINSTTQQYFLIAGCGNQFFKIRSTYSTVTYLAN